MHSFSSNVGERRRRKKGKEKGVNERVKNESMLKDDEKLGELKQNAVTVYHIH